MGFSWQLDPPKRPCAESFFNGRKRGLLERSATEPHAALGLSGLRSEKLSWRFLLGVLTKPFSNEIYPSDSLCPGIAKSLSFQIPQEWEGINCHFFFSKFFLATWPHFYLETTLDFSTRRDLGCQKDVHCERWAMAMRREGCGLLVLGFGLQCCTSSADQCIVGQSRPLISFRSFFVTFNRSFLGLVVFDYFFQLLAKHWLLGFCWALPSCRPFFFEFHAAGDEHDSCLWTELVRNSFWCEPGFFWISSCP